MPGSGSLEFVSGTVKISVTSADGRDIVLNIIREIALLDGRARTANATAMSDCELIVIERREFIPFLRSEPDVTLKLMEIPLLAAAQDKRAGRGRDIPQSVDPTRKKLASTPANAEPSKPADKVAITQREIS